MNINYLTYINIDSSLERFKFINEQLKSTPKEIEVFKTSAIVISNEEVKKYKTRCPVFRKSQTLKGSIGCFLSHKKAISSLENKFKDSSVSEDDFSMVIEDDITIDTKFWNHLLNINIITNYIDILFFDICKSIIKKFPNKKTVRPGIIHDIPKRHGLYNGAYCYAIRNSSLLKVLNFLSKMKNTVGHIDHVLYNTNEIITKHYVSNLIDINTDIESDRFLVSRPSLDTTDN
jgi:GR25 family glycosyltransferase involved in LPS biosynthesis